MLQEEYTPITTFWADFSIADIFGLKAVADTYKNGIEYAKTDYKAFTELIVVLNHKIWQHYESRNEKLSRKYDELWKEAQNVFFSMFENDKEVMRYYFDITD